MITVNEWDALLGRAANWTPRAINLGLEEYGKIVKELAKSYIGPGFPDWPPLAESTLATKEKLGYAVPEPLLREGELRDSIEKYVDPFDHTLFVGSPEKKALWHEIGTVKMPPRPFLRTAMMLSEPVAERIFGDLLVELLSKGEVPII